jgi:chondroitin 4-sulfotransferase 11/chondroitin 4-sulfotransferase 13/dermatan 4-sulfotransferase 1
LVDIKRKFIFCEIPKVACTDFKRLFRRLGGAADYESEEPWVHDPQKNGVLRLTDVPPDQARTMLSDPKWTKALFIRDPLERLLSGFLDKCRSPVSSRYDIHCPFSGEVDFGTFMRYIFNEAKANHYGTMSMDEHWRPQHLVCDLQRWLPHYQFQGNFSHLRAHTKFLLQGMNLFDDFGRGWKSKGEQLDLFEVKTDWHHTDTSEKLKQYYTRELADLALDFYKTDYEIFSLETPSWYSELK